MVLTIDIGNTREKVVVFDGPQPMEHSVFEKITSTDIADLGNRFGGFDMAIVSSVSEKREGEVAMILSDLGIKYCVLSHRLQLPFEIDYLTPETLGKDRIAALAGAYAIGGEGNYLVIDCGTCNTYDLLVDGHFVGGNIAPGLKMRLDAMHHFTAALPQCTIGDTQSNTRITLGTSTQDAITNGAYWGVVHEINGYIERYSKEYKDLKVILTGGLFTIFDEILDVVQNNVSNLSFFTIHEPMLVPMGLNFIANFESK